MTVCSGVFVGIGQRPSATRIWRRTRSARAFHSACDLGGLKGKYPSRSLSGFSRESFGRAPTDNACGPAAVSGDTINVTAAIAVKSDRGRKKLGVGIGTLGLA